MAKRKFVSESAKTKILPTKEEPKPKEKPVLLAGENFAGQEIKDRTFDEQEFAENNFAGTMFINCSFPNLKKVQRCDFNGAKFLKAAMRTEMNEDGEKKIITEYIEVEPPFKGVQIVNCDVTGTKLESERVNFA